MRPGWVIARPCLIALPVIGYAPKSDRVVFAFGHQHIGLTLGEITGKIVTDLAQGKPAQPDVSDFAPQRVFSMTAGPCLERS